MGINVRSNPGRVLIKAQFPGVWVDLDSGPDGLLFRFISWADFDLSSLPWQVLIKVQFLRHESRNKGMKHS